MDHQLRIYRLKPGRLPSFLELWRDHIVPARRANAFDVVGAWVDEEGDEFAWVVRYSGEDGFAAGDARYYSSAERMALPYDPRDDIARADLRMLDAVVVPPA